MSARVLGFFAITLTALAFVPGGAHLFALPNKINLTEEAYFVAQSIYRGWALLGVFTIAAPLANLLLAWSLRAEPRAFVFAALALLCSALPLLIFFVWTYPANVATDNWTTVPPNWATLRLQWEYSHAASAVLTFAALCFATLAVLRSTSPGTP